MKHGKKGKTFGRETKQRKALMRSLAVALIKNNRITTTQAKAKALRPYIEKMITKGKVQSLSTTRHLSSMLPTASVNKLVKEISPKYAQRPGGYTRLRNLAPRMSDGARMAIIEFV